MSKIKYTNTPIKEIGKVVTGKTPETKVDEYYGDGYMFITPTELHDGYNVKSSEKHITEAGLESIKSNTVEGTSVLVGCIGWDMGNVAICHEKCASNQQINSITKFKSEYNPYYVYYWLSRKKEYLFSIASVTRTPILSKSAFEEVVIPMPERPVQDNVVCVLKLIDDKIENNLRICSELESMAKTLYDHWFVQFDFPDENGRPYRTSGGEMVWNDQLKREIPKGWSVSTISQVSDLYQPKTISASEMIPNGQYTVYGANGIVGRYNQYNHEGRTIAITCRGASCGNYLMTLPKSWITGNAMVVSPRNEISQEYLYYSLSKERIEPFITGSAQPQITRENLSNLLLIIADNINMSKFSNLANAIREKIESCERETEELTKLRDWLLPMLMNGQATVE